MKLLSSRKIKILADENISAKLVSFLKESGHDVKECPKGISDSLLFSMAEVENRILLTHDSDFSNTSLHSPSESSGIVILSVHPPDLEKMKSSISYFLSKFSGKTKGRLFIVNSNSIEIFEK